MAKATDIRATPASVMAQMRAQYGDFDLDAAALRENKQAPKYFGPDHTLPRFRNALADDLIWCNHGQIVWLNKPYSEIPIWLEKVRCEVKRSTSASEFRVVCLLPSSTSSLWWQRHVWNVRRRTWRPLVRSVQFWPKRIEFGPHSTGAKWPSVVVEFGQVPR